MPKYKASKPAVPLPQRTHDYLDHGAPEGNRNAELFHATCQFRDAGHSLDDAESQLLSRAVADGLTESEVRNTIRSAFAHNAREPLGGVPVPPYQWRRRYKQFGTWKGRQPLPRKRRSRNRCSALKALAYLRKRSGVSGRCTNRDKRDKSGTRNICPAAKTGQGHGPLY